MWAVLYDDGMSLTTASERIARSLAEAERQRGRRVTVRRLDDVETQPRGAERPSRPLARARGDGPVGSEGTDEPSAPGQSKAAQGTDGVPEPIRPAEQSTRPEPISEPEPTPAPELIQVLGPPRAVEPTQPAEPASMPELASQASPPEIAGEPEPSRAATPARLSRLVFYALAAVSIVVGAALADHWGVLPRVGGNTSSGSTHVGGSPQRPQLLPPMSQPPVMHFSNAVSTTSTPAELSGAQNATARPTWSPTSAGKPQSATAESASGGPSAIARGG
jgi:hypothetical protein